MFVKICVIVSQNHWFFLSTTQLLLVGVKSVQTNLSRPRAASKSPHKQKKKRNFLHFKYKTHESEKKRLLTLKILSPTQESHLDLETRAAQTEKLFSSGSWTKASGNEAIWRGHENSRFYYKSHFTTTWRCWCWCIVKRFLGVFCLLCSRNPTSDLCKAQWKAFRNNFLCSSHILIRI